MVEQPSLVITRVGWLGTYTRTALEGGTYYPACVWLVFRFYIPRTLRVGKVRVKVTLKWPSGARLMLQELAHLALWV